MEQGSVLADRALFFARTPFLHKKGGGPKVVAFFTGKSTEKRSFPT